MLKLAILSVSVALAFAQQQYGPPPQNYGQQGYQAPQQGYGQQNYGYAEKPQPYQFEYNLDDAYGNTQYRKEEGDDYGNKRGSYGYTDSYGVYRYVEYVADENGFRATIKTNEPGTSNDDPAYVQIEALEPPKNVYLGNTAAYPAAYPAARQNYAQQNYAPPKAQYTAPVQSYQRPPQNVYPAQYPAQAQYKPAPKQNNYAQPTANYAPPKAAYTAPVQSYQRPAAQYPAQAQYKPQQVYQKPAPKQYQPAYRPPGAYASPSVVYAE